MKVKNILEDVVTTLKRGNDEYSKADFFTGQKLKRMSKQLSADENAFLAKEREVRAKLGLPKEKALIYAYMDDGVLKYRPAEMCLYVDRGTYYIVIVQTDDLELHTIHADYFAEMQKPGFACNEILSENND